MTKAEFLNALRQKLSALPAAEIERSINYYSEILEDRIEEGLGEEAAVASLEDPDTIAQKIIEETPLATRVKGSLKTWHIVLLVLGFPLWFSLLLSFFILILAFYIVMWSFIIAIYAIVVSLGLVGVGCLSVSILAFRRGLPSGLFNLGAGLAALGLAFFVFLLAFKLSKGLVKMTARAGRKAKARFMRKETVK